MRGPLFETFIISELMKIRLNRGLPSNLFFWQSNAGDEIYVIIEKDQTLVPVEIKAGQTVSQDFFRGLVKWQNIAGGAASKGTLVYAGSKSYEKQEGHVVSWKDIGRIEKRRSRKR